MATENIKWGILGLGQIANKFAEDLNLVKNCSLIGVASRSLEKAKQFALKHNAENYYESYRDLVNNKSIDLIYIATPHVFHFEHTMLCLNHNKAVLCEKPFAINAVEVEKMIRTAKSKKLFLMEAMWTRFFPCTDWLINNINSGAIGEIKSIEANFGFKALLDLENRLFNPTLGGGALMDVGIYPIYLSLLLLGVPKSIKANASLINTVDAFCDMSFSYHSDTQKALLKCSLLEDTSNEATIIGSKGRIKIHKNFFIPEKITITDSQNINKTISIEHEGHGYYHEIVEASICYSDKKNESSKMPNNMSLELITILDNIRKEIGIIYPNDQNQMAQFN